MLDAKDGVRKPQWGFVEVGHPFTHGGTITPAEIRAPVWHTLIAGARGIKYFQHSSSMATAGPTTLFVTGSATGRRSRWSPR